MIAQLQMTPQEEEETIITVITAIRIIVVEIAAAMERALMRRVETGVVMERRLRGMLNRCPLAPRSLAK